MKMTASCFGVATRVQVFYISVYKNMREKEVEHWRRVWEMQTSNFTILKDDFF